MFISLKRITLAILMATGWSAELASQTRSNGAFADRSWFAYGSGIGYSGIAAAPNKGTVEILFGGGMDNSWRDNGNSYWFAVQHAAAGDYQQVFTSPFYAKGEQIRQLRTADLTSSNPGTEIILALENGVIEVWSQQKRTLISSLTSAARMSNGLEIADLEGDGQMEIVLIDDQGLYILAADGTALWSSSSYTGDDITIGQLDKDVPLEIATTSGYVIDGLTLAPQWTWRNGFGIDVETADIDGDGIDELITADKYTWIWAYDVDRQVPKWSTYVRFPGCIKTGDLDGNGSVEVIIGETQSGKLLIHEGATGAYLRGMYHPLSGFTDITCHDVDGDGQVELIWGEGYDSSGKDQLTIHDPVSMKIEYETEHIGPGFFGPFAIDIEKDGQEEIVIVSAKSNAGYDGGRMVVLDGTSLQTKAIAPPLTVNGRRRSPTAVQSLDANGDSFTDLLVGSHWIELMEYDIASREFKVTKTTAPTKTSYNFADFEFADLNVDSNFEVVCASGNSIEIFDWNSGAHTWLSPSFGAYIVQVLCMNSDADPQLEIHALDRNGNIHVIDPITYLSTTINSPSKPFTTLAVAGSQSSGILLAGDSAGGVTALMPGTYSPLGPVTLGSGPLDHLRLYSGSPFIVAGSGGSLSINIGLIPAWTSMAYGQSLSGETLIWGQSPMLLTVTSHGFVAFNL